MPSAVEPALSEVEGSCTLPRGYPNLGEFRRQGGLHLRPQHQCPRGTRWVPQVSRLRPGILLGKASRRPLNVSIGCTKLHGIVVPVEGKVMRRQDTYCRRRTLFKVNGYPVDAFPSQRTPGAAVVGQSGRRGFLTKSPKIRLTGTRNDGLPLDLQTSAWELNSLQPDTDALHHRV